jgi:hypothetical protein
MIQITTITQISTCNSWSLKKAHQMIIGTLLDFIISNHNMQCNSNYLPIQDFYLKIPTLLLIKYFRFDFPHLWHQFVFHLFQMKAIILEYISQNHFFIVRNICGCYHLIVCTSRILQVLNRKLQLLHTNRLPL